MLNSSKKSHARLVYIAAALKAQGITVVRSQVPALLDGTGLKTNIDALGVRGDEIFVIELKTTQHSHGEHMQKIYDRTCQRQPELHNGLPNSERVHHLLQVAFGVLCMKKRFPERIVRGIVVISYAQSATIRHMPEAYASLAWFHGPDVSFVPPVASTSKTKSISRKKPRAPPQFFVPWPEKDPRVRQLCLQKQLFLRKNAPVCHTTHAVKLRCGRDGVCLAACLKRPIAAYKDRTREKLKAILLKSARHIFKDAAEGNNPDILVLSPCQRSKNWIVVKLSQ